VSAALRLLSDALRSIACVAAPCIRPADAGNAARVNFRTDPSYLPTRTGLSWRQASRLSKGRRGPQAGRSRLRLARAFPAPGRGKSAMSAMLQGGGNMADLADSPPGRGRARREMWTTGRSSGRWHRHLACEGFSATWHFCQRKSCEARSADALGKRHRHDRRLDLLRQPWGAGDAEGPNRGRVGSLARLLRLPRRTGGKSTLKLPLEGGTREAEQPPLLAPAIPARTPRVGRGLRAARPAR